MLNNIIREDYLKSFVAHTHMALQICSPTTLAPMESNRPLAGESMEHPLWKEIKESECYLVSCMYEEASTSSSSVLQKLRTIRPSEGDVVNDEPTLENGISELDDIMEAAGMVFIQAYKHIHRTRDIFHDLKTLFGSVALIPFSVLFTGVCMQLYEGEYQIVRKALDEFFEGWVFVQDVSWYIPSEAERQKAPWCIAQNSHLSMKNYLQIVELYAVNVLVKGLKNEDLALKWLEKLNILEEARQEIALKIKSVSRLQESKSIKCFSHPSSSHAQELSQAKDRSLKKGETEFSQMSKALSGSKEHLETVDICTGSMDNSVVSRYSKLVESLYLWFPALPSRLGNLGIAIPQGKTILILASTLFIFYLLKSKWKYAIRNLKEQVGAVKRVLIDFWQLAFNVQLNPLAAVQPLPSAPHVGR